MVVLNKEIGRDLFEFLEMTYPLLDKINDTYIAQCIRDEYKILMNTVLFLTNKKGHLFQIVKMRNKGSRILLKDEDIINIFCYIYFSLIDYFDKLPKKFLFLGKDLFIKIHTIKLIII
jgi:hypothetical protein